MAILTMAILTMAVLTMAVLTMAILTMAILTMALLRYERDRGTVVVCRCGSREGETYGAGVKKG